MSAPRTPSDQLTKAALDAAFAEVERVAAERGLDAAAFTDDLLARAVARLRGDQDRKHLRVAAQLAVAQQVDALFGGSDSLRHAGRTWWMPARLVHGIWSAIQDGAEHAKPDALAQFVARHGAAVHVPGYAVDDLLHDLGLGAVASAMDGLSSLEIATETLFPRPDRHDTGSIGTTYVRLAEVAALLIRLESFGLAVDPEPLVAAIRPALAKQDYLTGAELGVWWFTRERHRFDPVTLVADVARPFPRSAELTTAAGYKVEALLTAEDRAAHLWITPPRRAPKGKA